MVVRPDGTHVLPVQNKICQNHFFKIQFSFAEKLERADVFLILWDSCEKLWGFCGKIVFFLKKSFDYCEKRAILCKQQRASVTQLVEYHVANVTVAGSNPVTRSNFFCLFSEVSSKI